MVTINKRLLTIALLCGMVGMASSASGANKVFFKGKARLSVGKKALTAAAGLALLAGTAHANLLLPYDVVAHTQAPNSAESVSYNQAAKAGDKLQRVYLGRFNGGRVIKLETLKVTGVVDGKPTYALAGKPLVVEGYANKARARVEVGDYTLRSMVGPLGQYTLENAKQGIFVLQDSGAPGHAPYQRIISSSPSDASR